MPRCSYCGEEVGHDCKARIGQQVVYCCGMGSCNDDFCREERDHERDSYETARQDAEDDEYGRYRGGW